MLFNMVIHQQSVTAIVIIVRGSLKTQIFTKPLMPLPLKYIMYICACQSIRCVSSVDVDLLYCSFVGFRAYLVRLKTDQLFLQ